MRSGWERWNPAEIFTVAAAGQAQLELPFGVGLEQQAAIRMSDGDSVIEHVPSTESKEAANGGARWPRAGD